MTGPPVWEGLAGSRPGRWQESRKGDQLEIVYNRAGSPSWLVCPCGGHIKVTLTQEPILYTCYDCGRLAVLEAGELVHVTNDFHRRKK